MGQEKELTISLIIPVYNVSPYIERCLKSVMEQTYDRFECILVDDVQFAHLQFYANLRYLPLSSPERIF